MPFETDQHLRSYLDGNQLARERMCLAILATDRRFIDVRPRQPAGGPDGGRDLEAKLSAGGRAFGAIGFVNRASDSAPERRKIRKKFEADVAAAPLDRADAMFVFMTNVALTAGDRDEMERHARANGFSDCDVIDRERLRIALDQPSGFFIRFEHLRIPLSEAEQASFLAQYSEGIQAVVTTGFQRVDEALARLTFLAEAGDLLTGLHVRFDLDRTYPADEIGHYRAFMLVYLTEVTNGIWAILFGSSDLSNRFREATDTPFTPQVAGIRHGIAFAQWERRFDMERLRRAELGAEGDKGATDGEGDVDGPTTELPAFETHGGGSSVGIDEVAGITISYRKERHGVSFPHERGINLRDLQDADTLPFVSRSFARKVRRIRIFANGYELDDLGPGDFFVDESKTGLDIDNRFSADELKDPWVRLRPRRSSAYQFDFYRKTPRRMFKSPGSGSEQGG
jgi:hypothetical protein